MPDKNKQRLLELNEAIKKAINPPPTTFSQYTGEETIDYTKNTLPPMINLPPTPKEKR